MESIVDDVISSLTADGTELTMRQLGAVMKPVTAKVAGRFDGKAVSEIVRSRIAQSMTVGPALSHTLSSQLGRMG